MEGQGPLQPVQSAAFFVITKEVGCRRQKERESMEEQLPEIYPLRNPYAKGVSNHNVAEVTIGR